ncbi:hypothetical protein LCGC14_2466340, partial [marine sediment metagenome]
QPGENPGSSTFQGRMAAWRATPAPGGGNGGTVGTGFFSIIDGHELDATELANSNLVLGAEGFVYQPVFGEGPFAGQVTGFELAPKWLQEEVLGQGGAPGSTGPTAAELAIERSRVQAQNLSTFIQGTISELSLEIDSGRLKTEQALGEFNRRLDAFSEAGAQFQGIQPYTIPIGAEYAPGFQPGGVGEQLGIAPRRAETIDFDPFSMANEIVAETPVLTDIGAPSGDALREAMDIARGFLGG